MGDALDRARLRAPRLPLGVVPRAHLNEVAERARRYPFTLVEAPAGYGKTVFAVEAAGSPAAWYGLTPADRDLQVFVIHLLASLETLSPHIAPARALLRQPGGASATWPEAIDAAVAALDRHLEVPAALVLDDYHLVDSQDAGAVLSRLVEAAPPALRIVITARERPSLPGLMRWRGHGQMLHVDQADLAFTFEDAGAFLASRFGLSLTPVQCRFLTEETEGWPIALELIGQRLVKSGESMESLVGRLPEGREAIFEYLADEVLSRLEPNVRQFLERIACLRDFDLDDCAFMAGAPSSRRLLAYVARAGLFCSGDGRGRYSFHHLLREAVLRQTFAGQRAANRRLAARLHRSRGRLEDAIQDWLEAGDHQEAAADLEQVAPGLTFSGRAATLLDWIDALPATVRAGHPHLRLQAGRAHRLLSRFARSLEEAAAAAQLYEADGDAEGWFDATAETIATYLDTVQPALAKPHLAVAGRRLSRLDPERRARWHRMLAENRLNEGLLDRSERLQRRLTAGRAGARFDPRLLVRRGELLQARLQFAADAGSGQVSGSHHEREAMLALIDGMLGDGESARAHARPGVANGRMPARASNAVASWARRSSPAYP